MKIHDISIKEEFSEEKADKLLDECEFWLKNVIEYGNELLNDNAENIFSAMLSDSHYMNRVSEIKKNLQSAAQIMIDVLFDIEDENY